MIDTCEYTYVHFMCDLTVCSYIKSICINNFPCELFYKIQKRVNVKYIVTLQSYVYILLKKKTISRRIQFSVENNKLIR